MAKPEIYWTPTDGDYSHLIPGGVTEVIHSGEEIRIGFAGQQGPQGDRYHGILIIKLRDGMQTVEGKQSYKPLDGPWEPVPFSLVGQFEDKRFTRFTGIWNEDGTSFRTEIVDLPTSRKVAKLTKSRSSSKGRKPNRQR